MTEEEKLQASMLISGNFEGSDPWANITGNFDDEGLTCGQLGKTVRSGDLQEVMKIYLANHQDADVTALMPQTGVEFLKVARTTIPKGMAIVVKWSQGEKVFQPYRGELAAFWKSAGMVTAQKLHARDHEGADTVTWLQDWTGGAESTFHQYAVFFDIATQNHSMKGVNRAAVSQFINGNMDGAVKKIVDWCSQAGSGMAGYKDARKNAVLWKDLLVHAGTEVKELLVMAYLRALKAKGEYQADVLNRKGTLAVGEGYIHGDKWNFLDAFGLAGHSAAPVLMEPVAAPPVAPAAPASPVAGTLLRVMAHGGLNLRSTPTSAIKTNILATLAEGALVRFRAVSPQDGAWWEVSADSAGGSKTGFMAGGYLAAVNSTVSPVVASAPAHDAIQPQTVAAAPAAASIVAVHLTRSAVVRRADADSRVFKLSEKGAPARDDAEDEATRLQHINDIIEWLNSEKNGRYLPAGNETYCNIYGYDFGCLADAYVPRVWWTSGSIAKLSHGQTVTPRYDDTVEELTANDLLRWFKEWGQTFGWRAAGSADELQAHANQGGIAIIVARSSKGHGHFTIVVPETAKFKAAKDSLGRLRPVESQAGGTNHRRVVKDKQWWTDSKFTVGMYVHK